jgi:cobalt-zinc-cadmium efflux system protein
VALGLNGAFMVLEASVGWWTQSLALLADAGHMVSDVFALAIALFAVRLSRRQASNAFTFGLRRAPVLGALFNALSLIAIVVFITIEAIPRFTAPPVLDGSTILWTGLAGLFVNLASAWYLARSGDQSVNTRGAMLHLLADALGSVAAVIAGIAAIWGVPLADPVASVVIAGLILLGTLPLLRDTVLVLMQRAPAAVEIDAVRAAFEAREEVVEVAELHVWAIDSDAPILTAVLQLKTEALGVATALVDALRSELAASFDIDHVTIECRSTPLDPSLRC